MKKLSAKEVKDLKAAIASGHLSEEHKSLMEKKLKEHEEACNDDAPKDDNPSGKKKDGRSRPKQDKKKKPVKGPGSTKDFDSKLSECKELIKSNRKEKPQKEPVRHTSATRLKGHIHGIANVCLEKIKDDPKKIEELREYLNMVEMTIRQKYLGLKKEGLNDDTKEKLKAAEDRADNKKAA